MFNKIGNNLGKNYRTKPMKWANIHKIMKKAPMCIIIHKCLIKIHIIYIWYCAYRIYL